MKRLIFFLLIAVIYSSNIIANELEGGIFNSGSTLQVKIKATGSSFNSQISQVKFAIKYLTSYNVTFGSPTTPTPIGLSYQETKTSGDYTYQFYAWTGSYTPNWSLNSETLVMEVTISGGTGLGDFSLVSSESAISGSLPNWYVESSGVTGGSSVELYNPTINSVPLPVELSSFTSSVNVNNVKLNWKTETEVNNNGFEIQRAIRDQKSEVSNWEKIGFIEGHGNSNSPKEYTYTDKNLTGGTKFVYRLKQIDNDGKYQYSKEIEVEVVPKEYTLYQNYPNPFNPVTEIKYNLPEASRVTLNVYNIIGQKVTSLINGEVEAGFHSVTFDGRDLPSGTYIYRLQTPNYTQTKKMVLLK